MLMRSHKDQTRPNQTRTRPNGWFLFVLRGGNVFGGVTFVRCMCACSWCDGATTTMTVNMGSPMREHTSHTCVCAVHLINVVDFAGIVWRLGECRQIQQPREVTGCFRQTTNPHLTKQTLASHACWCLLLETVVPWAHIANSGRQYWCERCIFDKYSSALFNGDLLWLISEGGCWC